MSLGGVLVKKRQREREALGVVYRIPCKDCSWSYVGETGRTLAERLTEHKRAVKNCVSASEIAGHVWGEDHRMNWEGARVVAREGVHFKRLFKEAWLSRVHGSGNRTFHQLDSAWFPLF